MNILAILETNFLFILSIIGFTYLLLRYQKKIADKDILNKLIIVAFLVGAFLSATLTLPGFFIKDPISWGRFADSFHPLVYFLIPAVLSVLLYVRITQISGVKLILLIFWGIVSLGVGTFLAFFAMMDNPLIIVHGPDEFSRSGWLLQIVLRGVLFYILNVSVLLAPYMLHAMLKDRKISTLVLILIFPAIPFTLAFIRYAIALFFGV